MTVFRDQIVSGDQIVSPAGTPTARLLQFLTDLRTKLNANVATSDGTTGGTGSAGAGNQYVEIEINGTTYKVLHDGTV